MNEKVGAAILLCVTCIVLYYGCTKLEKCVERHCFSKKTVFVLAFKRKRNVWEKGGGGKGLYVDKM